MVEKVLYCPECKHVQEDPDKFSTICPKCGYDKCRVDHMLNREDLVAWMKESGFSKNVIDFYSKKKSKESEIDKDEKINDFEDDFDDDFEEEKTKSDDNPENS